MTSRGCPLRRTTEKFWVSSEHQRASGRPCYVVVACMCARPLPAVSVVSMMNAFTEKMYMSSLGTVFSLACFCPAVSAPLPSSLPLGSLFTSIGSLAMLDWLSSLASLDCCTDFAWVVTQVVVRNCQCSAGNAAANAVPLASAEKQFNKAKAR